MNWIELNNNQFNSLLGCVCDVSCYKHVNLCCVFIVSGTLCNCDFCNVYFRYCHTSIVLIALQGKHSFILVGHMCYLPVMSKLDTKYLIKSYMRNGDILDIRRRLVLDSQKQHIFSLLPSQFPKSYVTSALYKRA